MPNNSRPLTTLARHAGADRTQAAAGPVALPLPRNTAFRFQRTASAPSLLALPQPRHVCNRVTNPTQEAFEQRLAAIEGGEGALALASGQAAAVFALQTIAEAGDNIVSSADLSGDTRVLFAHTASQSGVEIRFVDPADPENFRRATDQRTRAYYAETLPVPKLEVFPIAEVGRLGRELGVPLIVDNTASPLIARPLEHGAAIVVYANTRFVGGRGIAIGAVVDGGNFDWEAHALRFPLLNAPDPAHGGTIRTGAAKPLGPTAFLLRGRARLRRDIEAAVYPVNAFQFQQGLETLSFRLRQHNSNAAAVADFLSRQPSVTGVVYPGLQTGDARRRADAVLKGGYGSVVGFELAGGAEAGRAFIEALKLFHHAASIGERIRVWRHGPRPDGARSLAVHPASMAQSQPRPEDQLPTGFMPGYVRLSVGLEHPDDIIGDLRQALDVARIANGGAGVLRAA